MSRRKNSEPLRFGDKLTSGQVGPKPPEPSKKPHKKFREYSEVNPAPPKLHQGADSSSYASRVKEESAGSVKNQPSRKKAKSEKGKIIRKMPAQRPGAMKRAAHAAGAQAQGAVHSKIHEAEQDNIGVEAAHNAELAGEDAIRKVSGSIKHRFNSRPTRSVSSASDKGDASTRRTDKPKAKAAQTNKTRPEQKKKTAAQTLQKQRQKRRNQKRIQDAAKQSARAAKKTTEKTAAAGRFATRHPIITLILVVVLLIVFLLIALVTTASAVGSGVSGAVAASSYLATDADIDNAELAYTEWEADLQIQINSMESTHPGYDEYRYDIDDIGHNPYELMAFLTAVYNEFSYSQAESVLRDIFNEQYALTTNVITETRTDTRTIQVGESIGTVRTTAYCNCVSCNGKWAGGPTASGAMPKAGHTIAVDAYNPIVPMGTKVVINGTIYTVEDTGNLNAHNSDIDIYHNTHSEALAWGRQNHTMYLAEGNSNSIEVTTTREYRILEVKLTAQSFTSLVYARMTDEQLEHYNVLMATKGNRQYLHSPFGELNWLPYVTAYYGYRVTESGGKDYHKGIDISMPQGSDILAGQAGTVTFAGSSGDYGLVVVIENEDGLTSKYAHCSALAVSAGQTVAVNDVIATTGAYLHLEVIKDGIYLNPLYFAVTNDYGAGPTYDGDPGPAMGDGSYTAMIAEAEKHLGKPYVFGASGPNSFDCSGFVCYVLNQSGVKSVGRTNAQGLYNMCTPVSQTDARPGDLIFFTGTYSTANPVTHVGIYVGNGTMIHAGKPVEYASINTSYWQSHFYSFGRLN